MPGFRDGIGHNASVGLVGEGLAVADGPGPVDMAALARKAVKGALLRLGSAPNLAFVFVTAGDSEEAEQALLAAHAHLGEATVLGTSAAGVIAAGQAADGVPAVAVWTARVPGLRARSFHLEVMGGPDGNQVVGLPGRRRDDVVALLLTDPWSFPAADFAAHSEVLLDGLPVVGAVASGPAAARATRFLLDGRIHGRGAVGVMIGGHAEIVSASSPACRPVGPILTVTKSEGFLLRSVAGVPAALRAKEVVAALDEPEHSQALSGMHLGVAVDDEAPGMGDFVIHDFQPAEGERGALQVSAPVPVGATVQFHVRDEAAADEDLNVMLEGVAARMGTRLQGALLFAATSRGRFMFGSRDHDAAVASARLDVPVAGFFSDGEFGSLHGVACLHQQTATVVAFGAGPRAVVGHHRAVRPRRIAEDDPMTREVRRMLAELAQPSDEETL